MDARGIEALLRAVRAGELSVAGATRRLKASPPFADLGFATVDHHRVLRQGHPEIVFAPGKRPDQAAAIAREILDRAGRVLVTRVDGAQVRAILDAIPGAEHQATARTVAVMDPEAGENPGVAIVSAGTADQQVAEEVREVFGEQREFMVI